MPKKRYPAEQIIRHLREAEVELAKGQTTGGVCRKLGITEQTYYRWRKEYGSLRVDQVRRVILPLPPGSAPLHPAATAYGLTWKVDQ